MRRFLKTLPLGLLLIAAPGHVHAADASRTTGSFFARLFAPQQDTRHRRVVRQRVHQRTSRSVAWFANPARAPTAGACSGSRVVAAWYASGRRTASGAPFNPHGLTAAHRSLPFGSRVTVTNPRNGQSVTVTINDRGPFTRGVAIDLARGAALAIGMTGTQQVCML